MFNKLLKLVVTPCQILCGGVNGVHEIKVNGALWAVVFHKYLQNVVQS